MISGSDLKKGVIIDLDGTLYQVMEYQHVKMKRTALAKVKLRDLEGGHTTERSFQSDARFTRVQLEYRPMQYLYNDGDIYYFMDAETFEQTPISIGQLGDDVNYLKEGQSIQVTTYKGKVVGVEMPLNVELKVTGTTPGYKGDTVTAGIKPATVETGITVQVPLFINEGDIIRVDTRDSSYVDRVSQG